MSAELEVILIATSIGASLAVYFRFIDKKLDVLLDKIFAGWHVNEEEMLEDFEQI